MGNKKSLLEIKKEITSFIKRDSNQKKEVAFYGGTFTKLPLEVIKKYLSLLKPFENQLSAIRVSTRPDAVDEGILLCCKKKGVKTIELGIQSFSDKVLTASDRGYSKMDAINACKRIKKFGFQLCIQLMPFLPGFSEKSLEETIEKTVELKPEYVRIYPTLVLKDTELERLFWAGEYSPATLAASIQTTAKMKTVFEKEDIKVIKVGLHSDIDKKFIVAGGYHPAFGEMVEREIVKTKILENKKKSKTLCISKKDLSLFMGMGSKLLKELKDVIGNFRILEDKNLKKGEIKFKEVVGDTGFEPVTSTMST